MVTLTVVKNNKEIAKRIGIKTIKAAMNISKELKQQHAKFRSFDTEFIVMGTEGK